MVGEYRHEGLELVYLPLVSDGEVVFLQEPVVLPLVRILVSINTPVGPVVILLPQEPDNLLPVLTVATTAKLS